MAGDAGDALNLKRALRRHLPPLRQGARSYAEARRQRSAPAAFLIEPCLEFLHASFLSTTNFCQQAETLVGLCGAEISSAYSGL